MHIEAMRADGEPEPGNATELIEVGRYRGIGRRAMTDVKPEISLR
jgi:hypothetical protein